MQILPPALHALSKYGQFILYKLEINKKAKTLKYTKYPVCPHTKRYPVSAIDKKNHVSFSEASEHLKGLDASFGIGFVFCDTDPFFFVDIDNCLEDGQWSDTALDVLKLLPGAAVEVSSSNRGLHVIGTGVPPPHTCNPSGSSLELYHAGRFVALTGTHAVGDVQEDCSRNLPILVDRYFKPTISVPATAQEWTYTACPEWNGTLDDDELIKRALRSQSAMSVFKGKASFHDLWNNSEEVLAATYPPNDADIYNRSEADAALAQHLVFWTGANCERIKTLMFKSALVREKWEREDYINTTVLNACRKKTEVLKDKKAPSPPSQTAAGELKGLARGGNAFLDAAQQLDYFAGCCYVRNSHCIMVPGGELLKPEQFKASYGGYSFIMSIDNSKTTDDAFKAFTSSQIVKNPQTNGSCFKPNMPAGSVLTKEDGRTFVNVWAPVSVKRIKGDATPFVEFMKKLVPHDEDRLMLLSYMSAVVQHQGVKFMWCPIVQGVEGNGKTLLTRCLEKAIGERYTHFPRASEIVSRFNDWMYSTIFIGIDDIYIPGEKVEVLEILKPIIDRERYEIEPKGGTKTTQDICTNFMLNSNHRDAIKKTADGRRFAVFYTPQQSREDLTRDGMDGDYFPTLYRWLRDDGFAIVADFLYTFDIPAQYNPATQCHRAPETSTTQAAIRETLGVVEQEILEAVDLEELGFRGGWISSVMLDAYLERKKLNRRVPINKRRALLQSLGYDWHPGLPDGRVHNIVMPDAKKPRLFVKKGHLSIGVSGAAEIARLYSRAQGVTNFLSNVA